jgi:UDP-perosamine 4-acetyltransferase
MTQVIGLGAGGHARVILDILRAMNQYHVIGLLDPGCVGASVGGVQVLGGDELLSRLRAESITSAFIGVGGVGSNTKRIVLFEKVQAAGFELVKAIHPSAIIAVDVKLGQGVTIMAGVIINPDAQIGDNVIINTGAIVEHDCEIASHAHISPGAILCGGVLVGRGAYVGAGATVRQGITIGDNALIGAGAVVVKDVPSHTVVVGVPARPVQEVKA